MDRLLKLWPYLSVVLIGLVLHSTVLADGIFVRVRARLHGDGCGSACPAQVAVTVAPEPPKKMPVPEGHHKPTPPPTPPVVAPVPAVPVAACQTDGGTGPVRELLARVWARLRHPFGGRFGGCG